MRSRMEPRWRTTKGICRMSLFGIPLCYLDIAGFSYGNTPSFKTQCRWEQIQLYRKVWLNLVLNLWWLICVQLSTSFTEPLPKAFPHLFVCNSLFSGHRWKICTIISTLVTLWPNSLWDGWRWRRNSVQLAESREWRPQRRRRPPRRWNSHFILVEM